MKCLVVGVCFPLTNVIAKTSHETITLNNAVSLREFDVDSIVIIVKDYNWLLKSQQRRHLSLVSQINWLCLLYKSPPLSVAMENTAVIEFKM